MAAATQRARGRRGVGWRGVGSAVNMIGVGSDGDRRRIGWWSTSARRRMAIGVGSDGGVR